MGIYARGRDLNIFVIVGVGDGNFPTMVEGLDRRVVKRENEFGKELVNEFRVIRKRKSRKLKKCV